MAFGPPAQAQISDGARLAPGLFASQSLKTPPLSKNYFHGILHIRSSPEALVVTGNDDYDSFCTLSRSKTLILPSGSAFAQMAAFLAGPSSEVHYLIPTMNAPSQTVKLPYAKYHLVTGKFGNETKQFEIPHEEIYFGFQ